MSYLLLLGKRKLQITTLQKAPHPKASEFIKSPLENKKELFLLNKKHFS